MGAGGIIHQRFVALLTAIKDPSLYDLLSTTDKAKVDMIGAKDPLSATSKDLEHLVALLKIAIHC